MSVSPDPGTPHVHPVVQVVLDVHIDLDVAGRNLDRAVFVSLEIHTVADARTILTGVPYSPTSGLPPAAITTRVDRQELCSQFDKVSLAERARGGTKIDLEQLH